jgi:hypothetical protein
MGGLDPPIQLVSCLHLTWRNDGKTMKKLLPTALCGALLALAATPALADADTDDIHCFMVFAQLLTSQNPDVKTAGMVGNTYYMGRLDGRGSVTDLKAAILAELPNMTPALVSDEGARCTKQMQAREMAASAMFQAPPKDPAPAQPENPKQVTPP